ncbi:MAG: SDR family oxidoreductase [Bacteroidetes bacterium]|nr:SDR family oxidoreductase [Bacteroidota bacterium]
MPDKINKIAVVTGGTGYLGRKVVEKFSDEGFKVYLPVNSLKKFMEVFDSSLDENAEFKLRKIFAFECNALDENSVNEFVEKVAGLEKGRVDVLVNTVGGFPEARNVADFELTEFSGWFDINFTSAFLFSKAVLKKMIPFNYGKIISIGSLASLDPLEGRLAYSVAKSAIVVLMDTISKEYKKHNIRANTVIPSVIDTPSNREWGSDEDAKKWVKPEDVARVIYSLADSGFNSVRESVIKVLGNY